MPERETVRYVKKISIYNKFYYFCVLKKDTTLEEITSSEVVTIYSISFEKDGTTEFEKFVQEFENNAVFNRQLNYVLAALDRILEKGALERFFRPEGKMNDNVQALPIDRCKLRLYCMRLSDEVIILGNGGVKDARAYEQSKKLNGYVMDLQKFDALLKKEMLMGTITIEGRTIIGIEDKVFRI